MRLERGLIVRRKYAELIVSGLKSRELRTYRTHIRGPIGIVANSMLLGIVDLKRVLGPFKPEELVGLYELHRVDDETLLSRFRGKRVRAREMRPLERFSEPIPVRIKRGARIRVRLEFDGPLGKI